MSATDDDTFERVRVLFGERGYSFGVDERSGDGAGFEGWFALKTPGGSFARPALWGATRATAARATWDAYRKLPEGADAPALD